ncbi:glycosyltransferase family 4 protein [Pontibacter sp. CAU 1760]
MNICFIGNYTERTTNGAFISTLTLARELVKLGHRVYFYYLHKEVKTFVSEDGIVHKRFPKTKHPFGLPPGLKHTISTREDHIDVFSLQSVFIPLNYAVSQYLAKQGIPYTVTPRGGYNQQIFRSNSLLKAVYYKLFEQKYLHRSKGVICISQDEMHDLELLKYRGPVRVIYNPINAYSTSDFVHHFQDHKKLVFLGRYNIASKGLDRLLHMFKIINSLDPTVSLDLYGKGPDKEKLEALAQQLDLKNFSLNGSVYGEEKYHVLSNATAYVHMANWEAFGRSIAESMLLGLPCIISQECSLADEVFNKHGIDLVVGGDLEKSAREVVNFLSDKERLASTAARGKEVASQLFNGVNVARSTHQFLEEITLKAEVVYEAAG